MRGRGGREGPVPRQNWQKVFSNIGSSFQRGTSTRAYFTSIRLGTRQCDCDVMMRGVTRIIGVRIKDYFFIPGIRGASERERGRIESTTCRGRKKNILLSDGGGSNMRNTTTTMRTRHTTSERIVFDDDSASSEFPRARASEWKWKWRKSRNEENT